MGFFHNPLQPINRLHFPEIDIPSYQSNESAHRLLFYAPIDGIFCTINNSSVLARERSQNTEHSWEKNIFSKHNVFLNSAKDGTRRGLEEEGSEEEEESLQEILSRVSTKNNSVIFF